MTCLAVIRVRGKADARKEILFTLELLGLSRVHHCVVVEDTPSVLGMVKKVKDRVTWGEISVDVLKQLLAKRGRLSGNRRLTEEWVKSNTEFKSTEELAQAVHSGEVKLREIPGIKPFFRLSPPSKGYKSLKRPVGDFGDLGYRGEKINELLKRMV